MSTLSTTDGIIPIGHFKTHASRLLRQLAETGRPIVITQNGRGAGVVISTEDFDAIADFLATRAAVRAGLADVAAGRTTPHEEAMRQIDEALGLDE